MSEPRTRPTFEPLEARDVPTILFTETFNEVTPPALPAGWGMWSSDGTSAFTTAAGQGVSGTTALVSNGGSRTAALTWDPQTVSGDTAAAVSLRVSSLVPEFVFARGTNLGTGQSSYLAAVVTRGLQVQLLEVNGSQTRVLGTVASPASAYYSGGWVQVTLTPTGSSVTVQVTRQDTGQYLSAAGAWQSAPTNVISATTALPSVPGMLGVGRNGLYAGPVQMDNFEAIGTAPAGPTVTQSFDSTPVGTLPSGWAGWANDSLGGFKVSTGPALSAPNGFTSNGATNSAALAWYNTQMPAAVNASMAIDLTSLVPAELFVRGSNLQNGAPTYYGVVVTRGTQATLIKVVNGVQTTLGTIRTAAYFSQSWVQVRLIAQGNELQVELFRPDTQQWLAPDGTWSNDPNFALDLQDSSITGGGYVGVGRLAGVSDPVTVDNFTAAPAGATTGPQVTVTRAGGSGTVTGQVTFQATATGGANRIEFLLNNVVQAVFAASPASWTFDSTTVVNGTYTLVVRASDSAGNIGSQTLTLSVSNPNMGPLPMPTLSQHNSTIGIAELAYTGTPVSNSFEQGLLQNNVDLVVSNPGYLSTIHATAPNTPQLIYNNVSNLYGSLLASWLSYARANNVDPELAFYHVTQPTPFTGASASSQPVDWFWGVYQSDPTGALTDVTSAAHGGRITNVQLGAAGTYTAVGYIEPYNEINVSFAKLAGAGWGGVWQYVSAVDANGNPTAWKTLALGSDGTNGMRASGQITFDPPADWVPAVLTPGGYQLYYVRFVATSGTAAAAPQIRTVLGADYVNANGGAAGTIPVFDYAADKNHDGYLNAQEWANRTPGDNARFAYQSRLFYPFYGQMRFVTNPSSVAVRNWATAYNVQLLKDNPLAAGIFLDNSTGNLPFAGVSVLEPTGTYSQDSGALVGAISRAIAPKWVMANTAGGSTTADAIVANSAVSYEEFLLRPETATWSSLGDVSALVARRLGQPNKPYLVIDSSAQGGSPIDPRTELATLAYYDLLAVPGRTFVDFFGGDSPSTSWTQHWVPAATVNIGTPTGAMQVYATGTDPENSALTYKVFSRQYSNGLVLYKPLSYTIGVGPGTTDNSTATTVQLNGSYRVVNADGTLGSVVTSVTLRNGEGAVLLKA
jgi:hypothetical protein